MREPRGLKALEKALDVFGGLIACTFVGLASFLVGVALAKAVF